MSVIAYLGPEHTNTHLAAIARFGPRSRYVHAPTVDDVFTLVERDRADAGVVPVENSLEGAVTHTLDRFIDFKDSPVRIVGEIEAGIRHQFITRRGVKPSQVRIVYSHPQALAQCRKWLAAHLAGGYGLIETSSTSEAVERVAREPQRAGGFRAALGSREAARRHRLQALQVPDERDNKTRFVILSKAKPAKAARNKTSILFALHDRPGALYDALSPFKRERINLTKIESRPSKQRAWEYSFFIDLEGHETEPRVKRALAHLARHASVLRLLGSYPIRKR